MTGVLCDADLYSFTGGEPLSAGELHGLYARRAEGPGRPGEAWHSWIVREGTSAIGYVQATVAGGGAAVAWVVGVRWQRRGVAREAPSEMCGWLRREGVTRLEARVHPEHVASARIAAVCGLLDSGVSDRDGERVWLWADSPPGGR